MLKNHDLVDVKEFSGVRYELRPAKTPDLKPVDGLHNAWIWLDNPKQFNSYTTEMVKSVILGLRKASDDRSVNCIILTAVGEKAFCTGGNTKEYAEYYAGNPQEYMQYMRLFNDMVTTILMVDKPVICRVNGMRVGGGQEMGMATDFTIASDLARFGQAGPKHGSAPIGGATDFLPLYVGIERAMWSGTLCELWTAYQAKYAGLIHDAVPVLKVDGKFVPNPTVITDRMVDDMGRIVYGVPKTGAELDQGKAMMEKGQIDLSSLDDTVEKFAGQLLLTFPNCTMMTIGSMRKLKLEYWQSNCEANRQWLGLNMMTEAKAGFRAFNEGTKETGREVDYITLRRRLAEGRGWDDDLIREISPQYKK
ncbi:MAG: 6-oxocyclohex-1-ene-1-carbonyl-CoA hydratase [Deltaproteobacteria bacterium]|nr:6-oxocyclohex-1-ene-1-carbonyl-CoA hydratase [Deltaproteobacteria bacterium]